MDVHAKIIAGRYQIGEKLGQGGMGVLYLANDPALDRKVVVKFLRVNSDELHQRLLREARAAGRLNHPNIVTIFDVGDHEGQPFIAMEYIEGATLADLIKTRAPLPLGRRLDLIQDLCSGLGYAHKAGIIHRDIKPANLMVSREGPLKILDFGIARVAGSEMTMSGMLMGTANYMAPEQIRGEPIDQRSDLFAVGAVLYELLVYRKAFPGDNVETAIYRIVNEEPESIRRINPDFGLDLCEIVERALQKVPDKRYQDLGQMRSELKRISQHLVESQLSETMIVPSTAAPHTPSSTRRRGTDRAAYVERRAAQVEALLRELDAAFTGRDYEKALEIAEQALTLDPDNARALEMLDQARSAIDHRQIGILLDEARDSLGRGDLTSASQRMEAVLKLDPSAAEAQTLQKQIQQARAERERAINRARAFEQALERARSSSRNGAHDTAIRAADDALALEPGHQEAIQIRRLAQSALERLRADEHRVRAVEAINVAREHVAAGRDAVALALLERFTPAHDLVAQALVEIRKDVAEKERRRREDDDRREAERRGVIEQEAIQHRRLAQAALERRRADEHQVRALEAIKVAKEHVAAGRDAVALALLERFTPAHDLVAQALVEIRKEVADKERRRREDDDRREAERQRAIESERRRVIEEQRAAEARKQVAHDATVVVKGREAPSPAAVPKPVAPVSPVQPREQPRSRPPDLDLHKPKAPTPATARPALEDSPVTPTGRRRLPYVAGAIAAAVLVVAFGISKLIDRGPAQVLPSRSLVGSLTTLVRDTGLRAIRSGTPDGDAALRLQATETLVSARQEYGSGNVDAGIRLVQSVMAADPTNPQLAGLLNAWLADARASATRARTSAEAAGPAARSQASFGTAEEKRVEAERHLREAHPDLAIQSLRTAAQLYDQAGDLGRRAGSDRTTVPPLPTTIPPTSAPPTSAPPTSVPVTSTAPATTSTPAVDPTVADRQAIQGLLRGFAAAYNAKDLQALAKVWPTVDARAYRQTFADFSVLDWRYDSEEISVMGTEATAICRVRISRTPIRGGPLRPDDRIKRFTLRKSSQEWSIVANEDVTQTR